MALVVLLRGVNVGGHKTFQPSVVAKKLARYDVVNIGAAGTFVARGKITATKLRAEFTRQLPFATEIMICDGKDILKLVALDPFDGVTPDKKIMTFVSLLSKRPKVTRPFQLPPSGRWGVKILGAQGKFVFGMYRREMEAIGHLGKLDKALGAPATTRNWNTILRIADVVK